MPDHMMKSGFSQNFNGDKTWNRLRSLQSRYYEQRRVDSSMDIVEATFREKK